MRETKQEKEISVESLKEAQIPKRFWELSHPDYFGDVQAIDQVDRYVLKSSKALENGTGLLFRGEADSGKTFLICYTLKSLILQGFSVLYLSLDELTQETLYRTPEENFNVKLLETNFIAVDNVEDANQGTRPSLTKFVNIRRDNALPFFIGTALKIDEGEDSFVEHFTTTAKKIKKLCVPVTCEVGSFQTEKHYSKNKRPFEC